MFAFSFLCTKTFIFATPRLLYQYAQHMDFAHMNTKSAKICKITN